MSSHKSSSSTSSTEGQAYPWILEHILAYPGTYEIPLRTMYTLNSTPPSSSREPRQSFRTNTPSLSSTASSPDHSPSSPEFPPEQQHQLMAQEATDHFKSCLMDHISHLPSQPFSLPASFITSFVRRCFTSDLCLVDFTQSLTAMDYLKDLENRRKRELSQALQRLGLDQAPDGLNCALLSTNPKISAWVASQHKKEEKIESYYTQVYLGLRRWTLINEMRLEPFSKANCIAMLNTLYPPTTATPPTRLLSPEILASHRAAFFRYITAVEANGKKILSALENQGKRKDDLNGWTMIREVVDIYLRAANGVIEECIDVTGPDYFEAEAEAFRRSERRADSGVSFNTADRRPSTSGSGSSGSKKDPSAAEKPLPQAPHKPQVSRQQSATSTSDLPPCATTRPAPKKRGTTLERIAREFRNLRNRNDVKEIPGTLKDYNNITTNDHTHNNATANTTEAVKDKESRPSRTGLRKMRSTTSIRDTTRPAFSHSHSNSNEIMPDFEFDAKRRRMILEAQREKESRRPGTAAGTGHVAAAGGHILGKPGSTG